MNRTSFFIRFAAAGLLFLQAYSACAQASAAPVADSAIRQYKTAQKLVSRSFSTYFYPNYQELHRLPETIFIQKIDSARQVFQSLLDEYRQKLPPAFAKDEQTGITYYFDQLLVNYPDNHELQTGQKFRSSIPGRLAKNRQDFNKPELLANEDFVNYVRAFIGAGLRRELKRPLYKYQENRELHGVLNLVWNYFTVPACRDFWRYHYLYNHIENNGIKDLEKLYVDFRITCDDTGYINKVSALYAEDSIGREGHIIRSYKSISPIGINGTLDLHIFVPDSTKNSSPRPVMVYFHGGSWSEGKPDWFFESCKAYAQKGWVACAVEYRTFARHGTLPFEAVKDARSAIRWLRQHAGEYNIDTGRIVVSGNSAGGHLVLCTALADQWNEKTDDLHVSPVPNVLLVNAGVYDLTDYRTAWIRRDPKDRKRVTQISPNHLNLQGMPPTLLIHGVNDQSVPYPSADIFAGRMKQAGNDFEFHPLTGAGHFIWYDPKFSSIVSGLRADFLKKLGY